MLSCKQATEMSSAELERPLRLGERVSLRTHLMMCAGCTNYRKQMQQLRLFTQTYAEGRAPSDDEGPLATER